MSRNARRTTTLALMLVMAIASSTRGARASCCGEKSVAAPSSCCAEAAASDCPLCGPRCPCTQDASPGNAFSGCCCCQSTTGLPAVLTTNPAERWDELLQADFDRHATAPDQRVGRTRLPATPGQDHAILPSAMVLFCTWLN